MSSSQWLDDEIGSMCVWDSDGNGPGPSVLVASGNLLQTPSELLNYVAKWNGQTWQSIAGGANGTGTCVSTFGTTSSPQLILSGAFDHVGGLPALRIAGWNGHVWSSLGFGIGATWAGTADAMAQWGGELVVSGGFSVAGGTPASGIATWTGSAWQTFADENAGGSKSLWVHNGSLYAGTYALLPGYPNPIGVLRWKPPQWVPAGANPPTNVDSLTTYQGKLIAGGFFYNGDPNPNPGTCIAQFDGTTWSPLGDGLDGRVRALTVFDPDGPGPMPELLIAAGNFLNAGGTPASRIAAWNGSSWSALGSGINGQVNALAVFNNQLAVGGFFTTAGGQPSPFFALWGCPQQPGGCYPNCDASITSPSLTANDFMCFLNKFANRDSYANCDGSTVTPTLSANDFQCFINKYAAGCN